MSASKNQRRTLIVLFGTLLLDSIGFGIVFPIIPILFTDPASPQFMLIGYSHEAQLFFAGSIAAVFGLMQFIAAPLLGELSDIYGRKRLLTIGVGVLGLSQLLFGFGIEVGSILMLFIARTIAGLAAANMGIVQATIADITPPEDRAKNFGLIGAAFGLGFIIGPLIGGYLSGLTGSASAPFWLSSILGLVNVVFLSLFLRETHHRPEAEHSFTLTKGIRNIRAAFADRQARPLYTSIFLYFSGFTFYTAFVGVLLVEHFSFSESDVGMFFGVVGVFIIFTQTVVLRIVTRLYSERAILRVSIPVSAACIFAYAFVPSPAFIYILIPVMAVPQGLIMAMLSAMVSKSVSAEKQGAAMGINGSLIAFSQGAVPLVAGLLSAIFSLEAAFVVGALAALLAWMPLSAQSGERGN